MLSGVVLSGGQSTRMGQDKGLTLLGGIPLTLHVQNILQEVADETIVSVAKGASAPYRKVLPQGTKIVEDRQSGRGPLEGLIATFSAAAGDYILVSPCDTPFLRPEVCRLTVSRAKGHDAAVPIIREHFEPLHTAYRRISALTAFQKTLERGLHKPIDAFAGLDIVKIQEEEIMELDPELETFWNLNHPSDLARAENSLLRRK